MGYVKKCEKCKGHYDVNLFSFCPYCYAGEEVNELNLKLTALEQQLAEKNAEIVRIKQVNTELEQKVAERDARIKELEAENAELKKYGEKPCPTCGDYFESNTQLEQKVKELETWQSMNREGKKLAAQEYHRQKDEIEQLQTANAVLEAKLKKATDLIRKFHPEDFMYEESEDLIQEVLVFLGAPKGDFEYYLGITDEAELAAITAESITEESK